MEALDATADFRLIQKRVGKEFLVALKSWRGIDSRAFVRLVYSAVLRRDPDPEGFADGVRALEQGLNPLTYLQGVASSDEFKASRLVGTKASMTPRYDPDADEFLQRNLTKEVRDSIAALSTYDAIDPHNFSLTLDQAFADFQSEMPNFGGQDAYVNQHRTRFLELDNIVAKLLIQSITAKPIVLDVGWSVNTLALQRLMPDASFWVLDRPNMPVPKSLEARTVYCDLTARSLDDKDFGVRADVIIFTEVLEHLLANPVKALRLLIRHLTNDGYLIVTTPNFFRASALDAIARRDNPQPVYPYDSGPEDAPHFHVREYCLRELISYAREAGGVPAAFFFSNCEDAGIVQDERPAHEWANMVVVVRRCRAD